MKQYLGDGVYVEFENGMVKLTTNDGVSDTNTIFLEQEVWYALEKYVGDNENKVTYKVNKPEDE